MFVLCFTFNQTGIKRQAKIQIHITDNKKIAKMQFKIFLIFSIPIMKFWTQKLKTALIWREGKIELTFQNKIIKDAYFLLRFTAWVCSYLTWLTWLRSNRIYKLKNNAHKNIYCSNIIKTSPILNIIAHILVNVVWSRNQLHELASAINILRGIKNKVW